MKKGLVEQKPGTILAFAAYTNKIPNIVKFTIGEPDFNTPEHIKKAAEESIANNQQYDPDEILITNGVTESIYDLLTAVINPGDIIVVPTPIFPLYIGDAISLGAKVVQIDTSNDGFKLKPEKLQAVLDKYGDKVRMLVMKSNRCDVQPRRTKCHCWCYSR